MQFGILGPLDVRVAGVAVPLGGAKQRLLLAFLLLHSNKVVPAESLIDLLWGDNPRRHRALVGRARDCLVGLEHAPPRCM